jgi:hypothetical protein
MAIYPAGVDLARLQNIHGSLAPTGGSGNPRRASASLGATLIAMRIAAAVDQLKSLGASN